ncbi:MAG: hypothetical protein ACFBZ8_10435 [Opitutales bacterium]
MFGVLALAGAVVRRRLQKA